MPRGAPRKHNPSIPAHIDQTSLPKGIVWQADGKGRWRARVFKEGKWTFETVAGPEARNSDLHAIMEQRADTTRRGSVDWILKAYHAGTKFKALAKATQRDYANCRKIVEQFPTALGVRFGQLQVDRLAQPHIQRMHERLVLAGTPSKANHVLRYLRAVFKWAGPHLGVARNPARGIEQAKERQRRRLPPPAVYDAVMAFARARGALTAHTKGSCPPYLWWIAEIGYLCRFRGIETNTLVEAQGEAEGIRSERRKGSRDNITKWNPRLRAAWNAALAHYKGVIERRGQPTPLRPEDRFLCLSEDGEPLTKAGLDVAWQRLIRAAITAHVITEEQRFSLHDLKRKGVTETKGTRADKQEAAGLTEPMMKVYDRSVPIVEPAGNG